MGGGLTRLDDYGKLCYSTDDKEASINYVTLRGMDGVEKVWHCVTRGVRNPKFCDITFQKYY